MDELEKLFADYKTGRTKYPQERAKAEDAFFRCIIDSLAELGARRGPGRPPKVKVEEAAANG